MPEHGQLLRDAASEATHAFGAATPIDGSDAARETNAPAPSLEGRGSPARGSTARGSTAHGSTDAARRPPSRRARAALPLDVVGAGMLSRSMSVPAADVVFVKGVIEASDGLASVFAERGGELLVAAPYGREAELAELLADLEIELGARAARGQEP